MSPGQVFPRLAFKEELPPAGQEFKRLEVNESLFA